MKKRIPWLYSTGAVGIWYDVLWADVKEAFALLILDGEHGTFYKAEIACFALFVGDVETAKAVLESAKRDRMARQIEPDGRQPHELQRSISFHYSRYNLDAMFLLARLAEHVDVDLWHYRSEKTGGIRATLDYIVPYIDASRKWPHGRHVTDAERARMLPLLRQGFRTYGDPEFLRLIRSIPETERMNDLCRILPGATDRAGIRLWSD